LRELAHDVVDAMAFADEQIASFAIGGDFDAEMTIAPARPRTGQMVGRRVQVESGGDWYLAQIVDSADGLVQVHYYGYPDSDDEWVPLERVRELRRETHPIGAAVEVRWKGDWFPAVVLDVRSGIHLIHYDGYGAEWDEWVAGRRVRRRR
jgi:hypothetical protein